MLRLCVVGYSGVSKVLYMEYMLRIAYMSETFSYTFGPRSPHSLCNMPLLLKGCCNAGPELNRLSITCSCRELGE